MMYVRQSNEDGTYTEKKVYSEEDMINFAEYLNDNYWFEEVSRVWWQWVGEDTRKFTHEQLLKLWEEQK